MAINLQEQIAFCEEKSKNIKLKTEPQTFVDIKENLQKLDKIEELYEHKPFGEGLSREDRDRQIEQIVKEVE